MSSKVLRRLSLSVAAVLLLSGCAVSEKAPDREEESDALTFCVWNGYENFLELAAQNCPDIELEFSNYAGANRTGYSWVQMRADDIPDIFITSQILDEELAKERLVDLSSYDFLNGFSTSILDQVAIDGGVYLLPVTNVLYGIYYNQTLMEENNWEVPADFAELETLCAQIRQSGMTPGLIGTHLTGNTFSAVFNLAKTGWLTTPAGVNWEQDFLNGDASAAGHWEETMDYVQKYLDIGMFCTDPEDRINPELILDEMGNRRAMFCTMVQSVNITELPNGDKLGMMPYIGEDGSKNIYMYSPSSYIGISSRLTEPGNEKKLENAVRLLALLYSPEGQEAFLNEETPCVLSVLESVDIGEDSMIYDAHEALREGRAFPMTYVHWENVLSDMGQAYKDWFRGEGGMDGAGCIARMDELQQGVLHNTEVIDFSESTGDFTLEETAALVGKALGSAVDADAVLLPVGGEYKKGVDLRYGITGKLYAGKINAEVLSTLLPAFDGEYAAAEMTGGQISELVRAGLEQAGGHDPSPYLLVTRGDKELEEDQTYRVAFLMQGYTEEAAEAYGIRPEKGSLRAFLRKWLEEQKTVSPGGNPWE